MEARPATCVRSSRSSSDESSNAKSSRMMSTEWTARSTSVSAMLLRTSQFEGVRTLVVEHFADLTDLSRITLDQQYSLNWPQAQ